MPGLSVEPLHMPSPPACRQVAFACTRLPPADRGLRGLYQGYSASLANNSVAMALGFASYEVGACCMLVLLLQALLAAAMQLIAPTGYPRRRRCLQLQNTGRLHSPAGF